MVQGSMYKKVCVRKIFMLVICFCGLLLLTACGGGVTFSEALQRQNERLSLMLNDIKQTDHPVHGKALFLLPSDREIQKNHIRIGNNASQVSQEVIDYIVSVTRNSHQSMADATRKRGIFDLVTVGQHNGNPASSPIDKYDFVIYVDVDGWFIKGEKGPRAMSILGAVPFQAPQISLFLDSLNKQAEYLISR